MPKSTTITLLLVAACACCISASKTGKPSQQKTGPYSVQLTANITLRYTLNSDSSVLFDVKAQLPADTAYFALGLSELGSMKGADMAIFHNTQLSKGAPTTDGNRAGGWALVDGFASGFLRPVADTRQDVKLVSLSYSASSNALHGAWLRPLVPCDKQQDLPLAAGMPVYLIWAFGPSWAYHGRNRGSKLIKFASTVSPGSSDSINASDVRVMDLVLSTDIPPVETTYKVKYFKLPDDRKYHIIQYEVIVGHPMLHHGIGYACLPGDVPKVEALPNMGPYDFFKQGMLCEHFFMILTPNITPWQAPQVAGMPFGANSTRYVALQLHYHNPEGLTGQHDSGSGIRIRYTPKLREHDVGLLTLGQFMLDIPPGVANYPVNASVCPSGCTSRFKQPVQLLSTSFHMHATGKAAIARHYRGGRELAPLGHLHSYDFDYQDTQDIYEPSGKVLMPGDILSVQCTFDSTSRTDFTRAGAGARDEMCFLWVHYFPAQEDMGYCLSFGNTKLAVCSPTQVRITGPPEVNVFHNKKLFANLMADGALLMFPGNPAVNSAPYTQQCSNLSNARKGSAGGALGWN